MYALSPNPDNLEAGMAVFIRNFSEQKPKSKIW